ncbi:MAG TPA: RNA polymerase sigma factor [Phycisphaerae bacterium]
MIAAIRTGDRHAFAELVRRHSRWVRAVVFGVLGDTDRVDDVVQQVWALAWDRIGELKDVERWRPWLYRLARNAAVDAGRDETRRRRFHRTLAEMPPTISRPTAPGEELIARERRQILWDAIRGLPALYREPFVLRHLEGWNYQQIADLLQMPVDSIETRLVRARRLLREALAGKI